MAGPTDATVSEQGGEPAEHPFGDVAEQIMEEQDKGVFDVDGKPNPDYFEEDGEEDAYESEYEEEEKESDEEEKEESDEDEPKEKEAAPDEYKFTVKDEDGEEKEVTVSGEEIRTMYDIFEKVGGEAEKMYDALETDVETKRTQLYGEIETSLGEHQKIMNTYLGVLNNIFPSKPDMADYAGDDAGFNRALSDYNQFVQTFQAAGKVLEHSQAQLAAAAEQKRKVRIADEQRKLFRRLPEWESNFKTKAAEAGEILIGRYGFTEEELSQVIDHRFYRVFDDLIRYNKADKAARARLNTKKGKDGKPIVAKGKADSKSPPTKGQSQSRDTNTGRYKKAISNLKANSRSQPAAVSAWSAFLDRSRVLEKRGRG